ncbi:MAG: DsrE family protein [Gemmatimonadetes bacterium]|nr:DsrE family protein [Gemmatimonadota bacterium]NIO32855.1 DsrE family protein [Gemmatimonadota bacterium]
MVFMYTLNAKRRSWFDEVQLIVWGPSSKLLSVDEELQAAVAEMGDAGVELVACKACADSYGVSGELEELGVEVKYMGVPLTEMLKGDRVVVTF